MTPDEIELEICKIKKFTREVVQSPSKAHKFLTTHPMHSSEDGTLKEKFR